MKRVKEVRIINGERIVFLKPARPYDKNPLLAKEEHFKKWGDNRFPKIKFED